MAELAEHPDMPAALRRVKRVLNCQPHDEPGPLCKLLNGLVKADPPGTDGQGHGRRDLHTQHPHAWITEVIHAFYQEPRLAAEAWKQLRYCDDFLKLTAERLLQEKAVSWRRLTPTLPPAALALVTDERLLQWRADARVAATQHLMLALREDPKTIDDICRHGPFRPRGPKFIEDLLRVARVTEPLADETITKLLATPDDVRELARKHNVAVPFSVVLEGELDQIAQARKGRGGTPKIVAPQGSHPLRRAIQSNLVGLAFSGGGIRSATFNLGVLPELANTRPRMHAFSSNCGNMALCKRSITRSSKGYRRWTGRSPAAKSYISAGNC